ncbi:FHA domain-containing protein [Terrabacter tumescens]|nr:FHA domain-containing protein [Terrabacter tumescens]
MTADTTRTAPIDASWVILREDSGEQFTLRPGASVALGRDPQNDVVIDDSSVSRVHATFSVTGHGVLVRDTGSTNGTSVEGRPVIGTSVLVAEGAAVMVGGVPLRLAPAAALQGPRPSASSAAVTEAAGATDDASGRDRGRRKVPWFAIVGGGTAVVGAVVGVLTYLQSRPSPLAEYRDQVATVCQAGAARQVKIDAAITPSGYDRRLFTDLVAQAPATDEVLLHELTDLRPPDEIASKHEEAIGLVKRIIAADREYAASLAVLPDSDFRRHYPDLPGDPTAWNTVRREAGGALVALSGGKCADVKG